MIRRGEEEVRMEGGGGGEEGKEGKDLVVDGFDELEVRVNRRRDQGRNVPERLICHG